MKNYSAIVCASFLAVALSACGGGEPTTDEDTSLETVESEVATEGTDSTDVADGDAAVARQTPFDTTTVVTSPVNGKVRSLPSLTPSASVTSRINSTSSGKSDPFAGRVISVRPIPPDPEDVIAPFPLAGTGNSPASAAGNLIAGGGSAGSGRSGGGSSAIAARGASTSTGSSSGGSGSGVSSSGGSSSGGSGSGGGSGAAARNSAAGGGGSSTGGSGSVASGDGSALPDLAARPPIPDPTLARGVEVTGVVLIGANYQAIVKAPNEPTSRYVSAGQRLSGGRVLVKRIENQGSEPVVILEENGVEVVRSIGAPAEGPAGDVAALLPELEPAS